MAQFLEKHPVRLSATRVSTRPGGDAFKEADHWRCLLMTGEKGRDYSEMKVYFSKGYGHHGKAPDAAEVLDCLASDAASIANSRGFEDWARDLGYDPDLRKAEKVYNTVRDHATRLEYLLGPSVYAALLWETERL